MTQTKIKFRQTSTSDALTWTGTHLFKGSTDSTTGFQIQDQNANILFVVDSVNSRVGIGGNPDHAFCIYKSKPGLGLFAMKNTAVDGFSSFDFYDNSGVLTGGYGYGNAGTGDLWPGAIVLWSYLKTFYFSADGAHNAALKINTDNTLTVPAFTVAGFLKNDASGLLSSSTISTADLTDYEHGTWTPVVSQSNTPAQKIQSATYTQTGKHYDVYCRVSMQAAGTGNNQIRVAGLPAQPADAAGAGSITLGTFTVTDAGTGYYFGYAAMFSTSVIGITHNAGDAIGKAPNFALASGDGVSLNLSYDTE